MVNYVTALPAVLPTHKSREMNGAGASIHVSLDFVTSCSQCKAGAARTFWHVPHVARGPAQAKF